MTQYDLKVDVSRLIARGSQLTLLSPADPAGATLGLITAQETPANSPIVGRGWCVLNAATVFLTSAMIRNIHDRVNDHDVHVHVSVQFQVSPGGLLSEFEHTYST
jgi:hypothetical protein